MSSSRQNTDLEEETKVPLKRAKPDDDELEWYFAIGSMMHPFILQHRDIFPSESLPAIIQDYQLLFCWSYGAGAARPLEGESFHGVVHKCTKDEMERLDKIERGNVRREAVAKLYDGSEILWTVYSQTDDFFSRPERKDDGLPSARYLDLMVEGCRMYGVAEHYIEVLRNVTTKPRKRREEFQSFSVPEGVPVWSLEDLQKGKEGNPYIFAINGKVVKAAADMAEVSPMAFDGMINSRNSYAGNYAELFYWQYFYDPFCKRSENLEDFTQLERDFLEDKLITSHNNPKDEVVGIIEYPSPSDKLQENLHKALVFCGPSGVGKSTYYTRLLEKWPDKFALSVSQTTRGPRPGEQHGVDYYYISTEDFEKDIEDDKFVEYAKVHTNYYGTLKSELTRIAENGQVCILDVDIQGVKSILDSDISWNFLAMVPPDLETLDQRLRGRGTETEEEIQTRLSNAHRELAEIDTMDIWNVKVVNAEISSSWKGFIE